MATENDYNLLVHTLGELAKALDAVRDEVEQRRLQEARERLEPNATEWVNLISLRLGLIRPLIEELHGAAVTVLESRPGEPIYSEQPPSAPDTPPAA